MRAPAGVAIPAEPLSVVLSCLDPHIWVCPGGSDLGDPEKIAQRTKEYEDRLLSPFVAAERGYIDEVIPPNSTRKRIARALALLRHKELENPWKKHDNIPL